MRKMTYALLAFAFCFTLAAKPARPSHGSGPKAPPPRHHSVGPRRPAPPPSSHHHHHGPSHSMHTRDWIGLGFSVLDSIIIANGIAQAQVVEPPVVVVPAEPVPPVVVAPAPPAYVPYPDLYWPPLPPVPVVRPAPPVRRIYPDLHPVHPRPISRPPHR